MSNQELFEAARSIIPGGVNSPVRAFGSVGGTPPAIVAARGAYLVDAEGNDYVDLVASWGPALLGHAHPAVVDAVVGAARRGLSFGASTPDEARLATMIAERVRGVEQVRLVSTGTEATMTAIRVARGATGRDLLVKFAGHYHGHSDSLLVAAGSGLATFGLAASAGVPAAVAEKTIVLEYNDRDAITALFAERGGEIAAIITEAAAANMGVVAPEPGFNRFLADTAHAAGALLIVDEVLTGFRAAPGGYIELERDRGEWNESAGPDLFTFGKVIGGGMPIAAIGGRTEIMQLLAPLGPVYQAGTLSGNPVALAAGIATLEHAHAAVYDTIAHAAEIIARNASLELGRAGVAHTVQRAGTLFSVAFGLSDAPRDFASASRQEAWRYAAFFHSMLDQGIYLPPSVFEAWFVTAAHDQTAIERVLNALPRAAAAAAEATPPVL